MPQVKPPDIQPKREYITARERRQQSSGSEITARGVFTVLFYFLIVVLLGAIAAAAMYIAYRLHTFEGNILDHTVRVELKESLETKTENIIKPSYY